MPGRTERRQKKAAKKKRGTAENRKPVVRMSHYQGPRTRQAGYTGENGGTAAQIVQKYLEPDRNREKEIQKRKREIMASRAKKGKKRRERETAASRVSYVKKPFAARSKVAIILILAAVFLGGGGLFVAVTTQGQATLTHGAMGFCSMFLSAIAVWYGGISFFEDDKNYILAKLGIGFGILILAGWAVIVAIGLGGLEL